MISIVNYKVGNLGSIVNMLNYLAIPLQIVNTPEQLDNAQKIILPGVGAFDAGMKNLEEGGWIAVLNKKIIEDRIPALGICLGMQLMTKSSEEGNFKGLGYIDAITHKIELPGDSRLKVPHMGWADVQEVKSNVFGTGLMKDSRFYFAHSYKVALNDSNDMWLSAHYGSSFCAGYQHKNILGVQFHPEKSHKYGLDFLKRVYLEFF